MIWSHYPALPWLSVVALGMAFGRWMERDRKSAYRKAIITGLALLALFVIIRWLDGFGNLRPRQGSSWIDWLNTVKYPPSISFLCMTLGIDLLLLGGLGLADDWNRGRRISDSLARLGRVPLFFYICHLYVYAGLGWLLAPKGSTLVTAYLAWVVGLAILYPVCSWYGRLKRRHPGNPVLSLL
ncbi:MAG: hypothetical protein E4H20_10745 [Spirochaetales bacterium]|nr:MAG: hypothetical protein E4H20_10745 [Spirochaetales bacterium]